MPPHREFTVRLWVWCMWAKTHASQEENINKRPRRQRSSVKASLCPKNYATRKALCVKLRRNSFKRAHFKEINAKFNSATLATDPWDDTYSFRVALFLAAEQQLKFLSHPSRSPDKVFAATAAAAAAAATGASPAENEWMELGIHR